MTYTTMSNNGWEYVFFDSGNGLTLDEKTIIADNIVECYQRGHKQKSIREDTFEARIKREKRTLRNIYRNRLFCRVVPNAIDGTERQKTDLAILVLDRIDPSRN